MEIKSEQASLPTLDPTLADWLGRGPYTLVMSASFFGKYAHVGLLCALIDAGLPPAKVAGSSAGALVAAMYASGTPVEEIRRLLISLKRKEAVATCLEADVGFAPMGILKDNPISLAVSRSKRLEDGIVPIAISAFDVRTGRTRVFTKGEAEPAVRASCSVPGLFVPERIDGRLYYDGGIRDMAGLAGVERTERVLYHHCTIAPLFTTGISHYPDHVVLSLPGLPIVHPFNMERMGPVALEAAEEASRRALLSPCKQRMSVPCGIRSRL